MTAPDHPTNSITMKQIFEPRTCCAGVGVDRVISIARLTRHKAGRGLVALQQHAG